MMTADRMHAASDLLHRHWLAGTRIVRMPPEMCPTRREEAYAIQALIQRYSRKPLYGWKVAATSLAGQAHIGVVGPLAGRILAERVIDDGGTCPLGSNLLRVVELEFAFRMARDLNPSPTPFTLETVLDHVATLHPAIEIPDSRFDGFETVGAPLLIADNACAHRFVLGLAAPDAWRSIDLASHPVSGRLNDGAPLEGNGANVLGDPRVALLWLANELSSLGLRLAAGCVVTTGTCLAPIGIASGDHVHGDFGPIGTVSLSIGD